MAASSPRFKTVIEGDITRATIIPAIKNGKTIASSLHLAPAVPPAVQ